jgi:thioredoxin-related protein
MDFDVLIVIILLIALLVFYVYINPNSKSECFAQEDNFEHMSAFDTSINDDIGNENDGKPFDDESLEKNAVVPPNKAQVIVFFGRHCPHCVHYDRDKFKRLKGKLNKLGNGNVSVLKVYSDKDPKGLFNKHDIQFVPAGVVISNGKVSKISGEISPANALATINKNSK